MLYRDEGHGGGTYLGVGWGTTKSSIWAVFTLKCLHLVRNWLYELPFTLRLILVSLPNGTSLGLLIINYYFKFYLFIFKVGTPHSGPCGDQIGNPGARSTALTYGANGPPPAFLLTELFCNSSTENFQLLDVRCCDREICVCCPAHLLQINPLISEDSTAFPSI